MPSSWAILEERFAKSLRRHVDLHSAVPPSRAPSLYCVDHPPHPISEQIGEILDGVGVGEDVPSSRGVAIVVEP